MLDVRRLQRMLETASPIDPTGSTPAAVVPLARYLRPNEQYRLSFSHDPEVQDDTRSDLS
jgi:hypothetical protein